MTRLRPAFSRCSVWLACGLLPACAVLTVPGDPTDREPRARISGDYRVRAGAPMNLYLRSVDGRAVQFWQHAAEVPAGEHRLLVDCAVPANDKLSRHELVVTLEPGAHYRLTAEAAPRSGCTQVGLAQTSE